MLLVCCFVKFKKRARTSPGVTERTVSFSSKTLKTAKTRRLLHKNKKAKKIFYSNWKQFQVFKKAKIWIQGNSTLWPMGKSNQLWPFKFKVNDCYLSEDSNDCIYFYAKWLARKVIAIFSRQQINIVNDPRKLLLSW